MIRSLPVSAATAMHSNGFWNITIKMINQAATRTTRDESGKEFTFVDPEMKQNIQQTLMLQIYLKYDHLAGPPENDNSKKKGSC